jgi:hypothetical protein
MKRKITKLEKLQALLKTLDRELGKKSAKARRKSIHA